jgi:hypothetical protein
VAVQLALVAFSISSYLTPFYSFALKANTTRRRTRITNKNLTISILRRFKNYNYIYLIDFELFIR